MEDVEYKRLHSAFRATFLELRRIAGESTASAESPLDKVVAIVRSAYPRGRGRYAPLARSVATFSEEFGLTFPSLERPEKALEASVAINQYLDEVRRGRAPSFGALLVRHCWESHREKMIQVIREWTPLEDHVPVRDQFLGLAGSVSVTQTPSRAHPALQALSYNSRDVHVAVEAIKAELICGAVKRVELCDQITSFVDARMRGENSGFLFVTSPAGFGKSTLAALWCSASAGPKRTIASHFCSTMEPVTTDVQRGIEYLDDQVSAALDSPKTDARPISRLVGRLEEGYPNDQELVLWLDGIDEASIPYENFLPQSLGPRVCVIISGRSEGDQDEIYYAPFVRGPLATQRDTSRMRVGSLSFDEFLALCSAEDPEKQFVRWPDSARRYLYSSLADGGHPLLSRCIAIGLRDFFSNPDDEISSGVLKSYVSDRIYELQSSPEWDKFGPGFTLLCVLRDSVSLKTLNGLLPTQHQITSLIRIPHMMRRWIQISNTETRQLSFVHVQLQRAFRDLLGDYARESEIHLVEILKRRDGVMAVYAAKHLIAHLSLVGLDDDAYELLCDKAFYENRINILGHSLANEIHFEESYIIPQKIASNEDEFTSLRSSILSILEPAEVSVEDYLKDFVVPDWVLEKHSPTNSE